MSPENSSGKWRWKRYPKYKDSGVEWLGEIPEEWKTLALKRIVKLKITDGPHDTPELYDEGIPFISAESIKNNRIDFGLKRGNISKELHEKYKLKVKPQKDDIFIVKSGATTGSLAKVEVDFEFSIWSPLALIRVNNKIANVNSLFYFLQSEGFKKQIEIFWSYGTQQNIGMDVIERLFCIIPTIEEQFLITTFLEKEITNIDILIQKKERQIKILEEKRLVLIRQVITKGLDSHVKMKDSTLEWIGIVPEHWKIIRTKFLFKLINEKAPDDNDFELISVYSDIGVRPRKELEARGNKASTTDGYTIVKKGDIIVNKLLAWMGAIGYSDYDGVTSPAYDILRKRVELNSKFYDYLFRCGLYLPEFQRRSRGIMDMRWRLYFEELGDISLVYPDIIEQNKIVDFLDHNTQRLDTIMANIQHSIDLLNEYRSALISAAVTGKIDVRQETSA